ncbi:hypothetical protein RRG08_011246 [Elysia crispata]|uniref:Uncharacterized protein n=1 Tax=Elysia crispata TaxID=231223 RepID=A0AAE1D1P7_9GAST|nr:hypothetical protein RRG08_011246 [Elysia crispata]
MVVTHLTSTRYSSHPPPCPPQPPPSHPISGHPAKSVTDASSSMRGSSWISDHYRVNSGQIWRAARLADGPEQDLAWSSLAAL